MELNLDENLLAQAKQRIELDGIPCVFYKDGTLHDGAGTGVAPLIAACETEPELLRDAVVIDKIVGKAAAMLAVLGGASGVFGLTMSAAARDYLAAHEIPAGWETLTDRIINRMGTGLCPMEETVLKIDDPAEALLALKETMRRLRAGKQ